MRKCTSVGEEGEDALVSLSPSPSRVRFWRGTLELLELLALLLGEGIDTSPANASSVRISQYRPAEAQLRNNKVISNDTVIP